MLSWRACGVWLAGQLCSVAVGKRMLRGCHVNAASDVVPSTAIESAH